MARIEYEPQGICPRLLRFEVEDNKLKGFQALGGCNGNLQGLGRLTEGMDIDEVIRRLEGIRCGAKITSCPDQLAQALKQYKAQQ
ncbi:TIGR03905 family TSCPD domain-containing protein [Anaerovibrio slackiae]|uniref:TIGR03905 family TSCPD domain-containing protein n=1 Tax=Anaerovibrio slackiae TaxID=2652309 RepID=UPI003F15C9B1